MTIRSMTGFARQEGHRNACSWHWEMRTVNGRGFDVRLRLPQGFEEIEQPARDMCKKRLSRGNCTATLTFSRENREGVARLNEDVFRQVLVAAERARELANTEPARLDGLLSMRGVIEYADEAEDEAEINAHRDDILADFGKLLDGVVSARTAEGAHLAQEVGALVDETEHLIGQIESSPARTAQAISARLREQVKRLLGETAQFDEQRIHQEAVLLAAKADVEEELARLRAHIVAARDLLKSEDPVGRKFEFLTQEFNREANTICSKSNDTDITQAGLSLKAVIDRMREQVQNIE